MNDYKDIVRDFYNSKPISKEKFLEFIFFCVSLQSKKITVQEIELFLTLGLQQTMMIKCIDILVQNNKINISYISDKYNNIISTFIS